MWGVGPFQITFMLDYFLPAHGKGEFRGFRDMLNFFKFLILINSKIAYINFDRCY
jgi:hypothetical protein